MNKRVVEIILVALVSLVAGFFLGAMWVSEPPNDSINHIIVSDDSINQITISNESQMSVYEAEVFIDQVISNHQYYLNHPSDQTFATGDSEWQRYYIKQYNRLRKLVEVLSK